MISQVGKSDLTVWRPFTRGFFTAYILVRFGWIYPAPGEPRTESRTGPLAGRIPDQITRTGPRTSQEPGFNGEHSHAGTVQRVIVVGAPSSETRQELLTCSLKGCLNGLNGSAWQPTSLHHWPTETLHFVCSPASRNVVSSDKWGNDGRKFLDSSFWWIGAWDCRSPVV
jgi:hypothetical protein